MTTFKKIGTDLSQAAHREIVVIVRAQQKARPTGPGLAV